MHICATLVEEYVRSEQNLTQIMGNLVAGLSSVQLENMSLNGSEKFVEELRRLHLCFEMTSKWALLLCPFFFKKSFLCNKEMRHVQCSVWKKVEAHSSAGKTFSHH